LEIYLKEKYADEVIETSRSFGIEAKIIGRVESSEKSRVTIASQVGSFEYGG
jgi:phosphoribosylformylglycinamidine cyclo-ligase